jgi:thiol-disulfide isomerase/thioredoxin
MKKGLKVVFYAAPWCGGCVRMKPKFYAECKNLGVDFEVVDVETEDGVERSIKHCVRDVPTLVFMKNGREIGREKGNDAYQHIVEYV